MVHQTYTNLSLFSQCLNRWYYQSWAAVTSTSGTYVFENIGKRAQMDLIDMSSQEDPAGYKWILRLVDHHSGHCHVRPLFTKTAEECGTAIIQILSSSIDFDILQSDNGGGGEFLGKTIEFVNK